MTDQNQSEEEKRKEEEKKYDYRIDPVCGAGTVKVDKDEKKKDQYSDWGWV